ncbi:MAG: signal peptidase I [Gammaproteobacteria bacterium]
MPDKAASFDFATILVILTAVTGVIWLLDIFFWRKPRDEAWAAEGKEGRAPEPMLVDWSRSFFPIILVVLVLRSFIVEPFRIPSNSMMPTLLTGDFILVNKYAYGLRLPVTRSKFFEMGEPARGDVAVFKYPNDTRVDFIKRIVALPGDRVSYFRKTLFVNGEPAKLEPRGVYTGFGSGTEMTGYHYLREDLDGVKHDILVNPNTPDLPYGCVVLARGEYVVPEGHYFAMGDNRDASHDSRCWGPLPEENLVGKAFMIWMSWDWAASWMPNWSRIGNDIN